MCQSVTIFTMTHCSGSGGLLLGQLMRTGPQQNKSFCQSVVARRFCSWCMRHCLDTWLQRKPWRNLANTYIGLVCGRMPLWCRCHVCQVVEKPSVSNPVTPLELFPVEDEPFAHIMVDFVGPCWSQGSNH